MFLMVMWWSLKNTWTKRVLNFSQIVQRKCRIEFYSGGFGIKRFPMNWSKEL